MNSFYTEEELRELGLRFCGKGVRLSRSAMIYGAEKISIGDYSRIDDFCVLSGTVTLGAAGIPTPLGTLTAGTGAGAETAGACRGRKNPHKDSALVGATGVSRRNRHTAHSASRAPGASRSFSTRRRSATAAIITVP